MPIANAKGRTWVTNAGSHGKFLAVFDLKLAKGRLQDMRYRLLPVFADLLEPDPEMQSLIDHLRHRILKTCSRRCADKRAFIPPG